MTNAIAPIAAAVERKSEAIHAAECRHVGCGRWPEHRAAAREAFEVASTKVADWPLHLEGARCARCDTPVAIAGAGPISELEAALRDHLTECEALRV